MEIRVQRPARALQHRHAAGAAPPHTTPAGAPGVEAEQHARVHPQHRAAQPVIPRQLVAQPIRHRQHPLPHRHTRQHRVHQMGGPLRHPPAPAAGTPGTPFTRKWYQVLARPSLALKGRHARLEHVAQQELPKLALDELRQAGSFARFRHRAQERLQMLSDHPVEHGVLGVSRSIHVGHTRHAPA